MLYLQNLTNPAFHLPMKIPMTDIPKTLFQLSYIYVGGAMLFNHLEHNKILRVGIHVATSLMAVSDVSLGTLGVSLGRFFLHKETESSNSTISGSSLRKTCLQEVHGKNEFLQAIQMCGLRDSDYLVRSFPTMRMQEDQLFASIRTFYCFTCNYLPWPRSYCEHTVWAKKFGDRQRPLRAGAYPEALTRKIASHRSTLASVS